MEITPYNISLLHAAAHFMEMTSSVSGTDTNLMELTQKLLDEIRYWMWPELLVALKQCQELLPESNVSTVIEKCLDSLIRRLVLASETSPSPSISSSNSSACRLSCDTKSTESLRNGLFSRSTWWFEDLLFVSPSLLEMMIRSMISHKLDHVIISKFLFYYQKSKLPVASSSLEKGKIIEAVIDALCMLERSSVSCKSLFGILRVALGLNMSRGSRNKLESMIGSQMDQATLDNLLVPSPYGTNYLYDVNLVLRFIKAFLCFRVSKQLKKVGGLLDLYIAEVAPDPCLKLSKFIALVSALPDSARDSYDEIYRAMDMYLEVHSGLSEEEKMRLCSALNYDKLSPESHKHLSQNTKFPSKTAIQALRTKQCKLKSLLQASKDPKLPNGESPCALSKGKVKDEEGDQIVIYAGELDPMADNERLRAHLQGMQWRVMELEKVCWKMQTQMTKILKAKTPSHSSARSLPKLCS
ncbi:BTB/POZ domain-containing protein At3g22104 isoform X2 [Punica granatum]|nr:BTB/POZ domain-containing protein At3g22104 isoform X2 [Punica granatum]XP_031382807.1 BTB/POZ domain-containing protein At3g22104 isoform X2 [Punica granatum]OWM78589.1 hypothetical protein CDL15_Pgr002756 [Punica granatum]